MREVPKESKKQGLPEAAEVNLMSPDAGVQLACGELLVHDKADVAEQPHTGPTGITANYAEPHSDQNPVDKSSETLIMEQHRMHTWHR